MCLKSYSGVSRQAHRLAHHHTKSNRPTARGIQTGMPCQHFFIFSCRKTQMEQIFSPSDMSQASCAVFPLPRSLLPCSQHPPPPTFSSPDGAKEAIVSLVIPADSLSASTWISCWAGFLAGVNFLSSWSKDFKLHTQRAVEFGFFTRTNQCKVWATLHLILRDPHRSRKDHLFFLGVWSIQNLFQNVDLVLPDDFFAECRLC